MTTLVLAIASTAISVVSATIAGFSAISSRRSSASAATQVHIARTPAWKAELDGDVLKLRLQSNHALKAVAVRILDSPAISFSTSQDGVDSAAPSPVMDATGGPLTPGKAASWRLRDGNDRRPRVLRLAVRGYGERSECWEVPVEVELPPQVERNVW
ncbi:hypothetical protein [Nocardia tengchongensis]|uniref:hypothetical protein n=1 Tax=Nocardia tengchongensis TaxID=2055889 RepID=UPI003695194D